MAKKIEIPKFPTMKEVLKMNRNLKISSPEWARDNLSKYSEWNKNIREGHPEKNLKLKGSLKKGGKIKKTGIYKLHKGERVLTKKQQKKLKKKKKY